jgi:hypothetical protein
MRVPSPLPDEPPLVGWDEIARYLDVSCATVRRWADEKTNPLPFHVTKGHPWASPSELQIWLRQNTCGGQASAQRRKNMSTDEHSNGSEAESDCSNRRRVSKLGA